MYLPVYYISFESCTGFYEKVKINVLENCQMKKGGNRDYCSHFSLILKQQVNFKLFL